MFRKILFAAAICGLGAGLGAILSNRVEAHTRITTNVTWSGEIRTIVAKNCMPCHRPGGIAPEYVDLTVYGTDTKPGARAWAIAIEEMVLTRQMPPWQADPRFGEFSNAHALTTEEENTLIAWIRGGAPQGPERNLPAPEGALDFGWSLAEPDFVVDFIAPFVVPAATEYATHLVVKTLDIEKDTYLTAYEFLPEHPQLVKSMSAWIHDSADFTPQPIEMEVQLPYDPLATEEALETTRMRPMPKGPHFLGVWFRGDGPVLFPDASGRLVRAGSTIEMLIEYERPDFADAVEIADSSKLGLFFALEGEEIDLLVESTLVDQSEFTVPADDGAFLVTAEHTFTENAHLINLAPRMNRLGSKLEARLVYPDGLERVVLLIPDFNWQWNSNYTFDAPIAAPAGARLILKGWFDNTAENWDNPNDPPAPVKSGEGRYDEVLLAMADYTIDDHLYVQEILIPDLSDDAIERSGGGMQIVSPLTMQEQMGAPTSGAPVEPVVITAVPVTEAAAKTTKTDAEVYWCPMRGNPCEIRDFDAPGECPECWMELKPKSSFFEGKDTAPDSADWVLTKAGLEEKYWCPNRGNADHELIDYPAAGECPVDGEALVHSARFKLVRTFTCMTPDCDRFKDLFFGPGLCPSCGQPVTGMGHMDHNPLHGGWQFFMADNLYHHLEGTMPEPGRFVLYFYDDWKTPLDARNFTGKLFVLNENAATGEVTETEYPLYVDREGDEFLVADLPEELPIAFYTKVWLAGVEKRFDFEFEELTVVDENAMLDPRLHAHKCPPIALPADAQELAAFIITREDQITSLIDQDRWYELHCPAYEAKAAVDVLAIEPGLGFNVRQAGSLKKATALINRGALALDRAGDSADAARVERAMATFGEGIALLRELFPDVVN